MVRSLSEWGLRASLQTESLVTGVLYIDLRHQSERAAAGLPSTQEASIPSCPPSRPQIQQLMNNLASLDIKSIQTNLNALLVKLDTTVETCTWRTSITGVTNLLLSVESARYFPGDHQRPGRRADDPGPIPAGGREAQQPD